MLPATSTPFISARYWALPSTWSAGIDAGLQDLLVVIDVVDEAVERGHALAQATLHLAPFVGRDDARDQVERNQPLGAAVAAAGVVVLRAVDGESDADAAKDDFGFLAPGPHHLRRLFREPTVVAAVVLTHRAVHAPHLVEADCHVLPPAARVAKSAPRARRRLRQGSIGSPG